MRGNIATSWKSPIPSTTPNGTNFYKINGFQVFNENGIKNNSWITTIAFALIEFPIIIFLSYFSIGSKDDVMEIYHSDPSRIIFIKGCISFVITSFLMSLIMLLYVIIKRILLNVRVTRKKIFISLGLNFVIISVEIIGILTYKLMTRGYI